MVWLERGLEYCADWLYQASRGFELNCLGSNMEFQPFMYFRPSRIPGSPIFKNWRRQRIWHDLDLGTTTTGAAAGKLNMDLALHGRAQSISFLAHCSKSCVTETCPATSVSKSFSAYRLPLRLPIVIVINKHCTRIDDPWDDSTCWLHLIRLRRREGETGRKFAGKGITAAVSGLFNAKHNVDLQWHFFAAAADRTLRQL